MWSKKLPPTSLLVPLFLIQLLWTTTLHAREEKKAPRISKYKLDNPTPNFFYFDDSEIIILHDRVAGIILRSEDAGENWEKVDDIKNGTAWDVQPHPFDDTVAYVLGQDTEHWITNDRGKSWTSFTTEAPPSPLTQPLSFHATDSKKVLLHTLACTGFFDCEEKDYYTKDGFKTSKKLRKNTRSCIFVHSTLRSEVDEKDLEIPEDRIVCVVLGWDSPYPKDYRVVYSDDYFGDGTKGGYEPYLDGDRIVKGIIKMAMVKGYLVAATKAERTAEMALYVTKDAITWHRAEFPKDHKLEEDAYTILESTNYSIQVDVMTTKLSNPMGVLFTSNSNGTNFTRNIEHTNRNGGGNVDFEKIQGIQGIVLVNVVDNWKDVTRSSQAIKKIKTKISFHDGRNFEPITYKNQDLHLHSVTDVSNLGRIYSSRAPGIVMGVGNTGDYLRGYEEGDLYVSDDAGKTWNLARKEAHKYEFGDQGAVLVAIYDEGPTNEIAYSLDHGEHWDTADLGAVLGHDEKVRAKVLTTTPDSTSLKFVLLATVDRKDDYVFSIDFEGLHEKKCEDDDFEKWYARPSSENDPGCIMGQRQWYRRRKAGAKCFVGTKFVDPEVKFDQCPCTDEDFECDFNFKWNEDQKECVPADRLPVPGGQCKKAEDSYKGSSGYQLIPGNKCKGGVDKTKEVDRPCHETEKAPVSGKISKKISTFRGNYFTEHYYLERAGSSSGKDQTVIMRTDEKKIHISRDHGKTWSHVLEGKEITAIYPHQYNNDAVYFLTKGTTVHYTINRGETFDHFEAEAPPTRDKVQIMGFHEDKLDWLLWTGAVDCPSSKDGECHSVTYYSEDRGDNWKTLARYVRKCEFIKREGRKDRGDGLEKLIYCEKFKGEKLGGPLQLLSSTNWFGESQVKFPDVIDFATMSEFIIVAAKDSDQKSLKIDTSVDGKIFADALFPENFKVPHRTAYTVLDSSTHAIFLHVTVEDRPDFEYGSIVKSNYNGTSYVLSLEGVNRNGAGFADFEKMLGLPGVALTNVVANIGHAADQSKKLKSMITHNDGAQWALLPAPQKDAKGNDFNCDAENDCSLHLHAYTERDDPRKTFSSPSAVGLMMGVGNVGEYLTRKSDGDLFLTRDGGVTWFAVKTGNYMWEYGDQGSILVIVKEKVATRIVHYSRDEGKTWTDFEFSDSEMIVSSITTVPSDTSRNFLLWGKDTHSDGEIVTVNLDFTGLTDKQCKLMPDDLDSEARDYTLWTPKHPQQSDDCLFGKVAQYHRKKTDSDCYNGPKILHPGNFTACACARQDFECDYNYERASDGSCQLVGNHDPPDHSQACRDDPKKISYFLPTGYRRIPLSDCSGGKELEKFISKEHACPGHEKEFGEEMLEKQPHLSGFWLFIFAVVLPIGIAFTVGYWVWNNWGRQFGRIKLGGDAGSEAAEQPWITYPIMAVSALVAVVATIPMLLGSLWRSATGLFGGGRRYTTRSSFARGRSDYAVVDPDEDELLGEDDDEEA